eukprot:TRINITY_DN37419_c0_g1_i1.p1 TRINITY_DN37419_c0_g1~~TRINITY_DN37419_c0_g1_i1.p1  ORF type:complete len:890 (-),score=139.08 TRINITY_DN37419_c0_g1_i1:69-2699(-)
MAFEPPSRGSSQPLISPLQYELIVLVENLTEEEFELVGAHADAGNGSLLESFQRSAKLSWHCGKPCAAAAEYVTIGSSPRRFCFALSLPDAATNTSGSAKFIAGMAASSGWRRADSGLSRAQPPLEARLLGAMRDAQPIDGMLGAAEGCDWLVLQNEPSLLKVRIRLLPSTGVVPFSSVNEVSPSSSGSSPLTSRDMINDDELRRLQLYCETIKARNLDADRHERVTSTCAVDSTRLQALSEKVQVDLAMLVLGILLQRRLRTLEVRPPYEPAAKSKASAPPSVATSLSLHADRFFRSLVAGMGFKETRVEQKISCLACQYLDDPDLPPPDAQEICRELQESFGVQDAATGVPESWLLLREIVGLALTSGKGAFDARSRAVLFELAIRFGVTEQLMVRWEADIGEMLFDALNSAKVVKKQQEDGKHFRRGKVALAAAGGGLLLAVTGGLAAPAVAAGVAGLGSAAASVGTAVGLSTAGAVVGTAITSGGILISSLGAPGAAVVFGATGAGLTGWKLSTRWGALKEFKFEPLSTQPPTKEVTVELSAGGIEEEDGIIRQLDMAVEAGAGELLQGVIVRQHGELGIATLPRGSRMCARETVDDGAGSTIVRYRFLREQASVRSAVHLVIFVPGWLSEESDLRAPWLEGARLFFPRSGHLCLRWESELLKDLSSVLAKMVRSQIASSAASFWLRGAAAASAASPVVWPVWIISSMASLDNKWLVCAERARLAGQCLAHVLADKYTVGQRPVTLIGHSMGARLIFYCLNELYQMGELNAVDDVVLFATPVTTLAPEWKQARTVVSGRLINAYLPSDWVLAFLYRYLEWGISVAGLSEVKVPGVENIDVSGIGVSGHQDYMRHGLRILAKARAGERCPGQL